MLGEVIGYLKPGGFGAHKEMPFNFVARRLIQAAQRDTYFVWALIVGADQAGTANGAEGFYRIFRGVVAR